MTLNGEGQYRSKPMGIGDLFITLVGRNMDDIDFIVTQRVEEVLVRGDENSFVGSSIVCITNYKSILN